MTDDTHNHLDENALSLSLVDETMLSPSQQRHLAGCSACMAEKEKTAQALNRIGQKADALSPEPERTFHLPQDTKANNALRPKRIKPIILSALGLIAAIVVMWQFPPSLFQERGSQTDVIVSETDDQFMRQIGALVNNALPGAFQEITGGLESIDSNDMTEFIVPAVNDHKEISFKKKNKGVLPC